MSSAQKFKLFVPSGYRSHPLASGQTGAMPDARIASVRPHTFYRSALPATDRLKFTFEPVGASEAILNFHHMGEFFIVSGEVAELFAKQFGGALETATIRVEHQNGSSSSRPYLAARINRVVDCIDPERSTWRPIWPQREYSFAEGLARYELDERCWREFSNDGDGRYASYPSSFEAKRVRLIDASIPDNTSLFQPKFWPGHWIIEMGFARRLERCCAGGTPGYYFWTLGLDDVSGSYHQLMRELR